MMSSVILDSNILILFLVGHITPNKISSHNATSIYTLEHFEFLLDKVRKFDHILTCPNIVTEVDNVLNNFKGENRNTFLDLTKTIYKNSIEKYISTKSILDLWQYDKLGITDTAILSMANECDLLISGDSGLCDQVVALGLGSKLFDFKKYVNAISY